MPILPEERHLSSLQREVEEEYGMRLDGQEDGNSASISLYTSIASDVDYAIKRGDLVVGEDGYVALPDGAQCIVQFKMDACRVWSKIQQCSVGYTFVNACANPQSPYSTTEFCLFEGDDHWDSVFLNATQSLAEMNELAATPRIELKGARSGQIIAFVIYAGGDCSNIADMLCISGCNGPYPCPWCHVKRENMNPFKKSTVRPQRRTLESIGLLTHTTCGVCPGCRMEIVPTQADVKDSKKQMARADASKGDEVPSKGKWSAYLKSLKLTWLEAHFGHAYGHFILIRVSPNRWIACLLHANLRITSGIINILVFKFIGEYGKAEDQTKALKELLDDAGIWVREGQLKPKSKDLSAPYEKGVNFVGRDAEGINMLGTKLIDIVIPSAVRATNNLAQVKYEKIVACWDKWKEVWRVLNNGVGTADNAREERAVQVQELADEFRVLWYKAAGSTQGLYIHMLHEHFADMVREVGDLRPYQSQGLEHLHSFRKLIARHLTNRQKKLTSKNKRNRVTQTMATLLTKKHLMRKDMSGVEEKQFKVRTEAVAKQKIKRVSELGELGILKVL